MTYISLEPTVALAVFGESRADEVLAVDFENSTSICEPPIGSIAGQIPLLLEEMGRLLESEQSPREFYQAFIDRLVLTTRSLGAGVWQRTTNGDFTLVHAHHWNALGLDAIPDGPICHQHVLQVAAQRERALWVPPRSGRKIVGDAQQAANLSEHGLLIAPVSVDSQVVGLVEVWLESAIDGPQRRDLARLLTEMAGFVAAFLRKSQLQGLLQQQRIWRELEAFSQKIHSSLDLTTVAHWITNEGRRLLECDQLSLAIRLSKTTEVAAISGASTIERHSKLVQALQTLSDCIVNWGEKLVYDGARDETLPAAVSHALDVYLAESNATALVALPLKDPRAAADLGCGVLVAESHHSSLSVQRLAERMETVANHAGPALANARHVDRLPLRTLSQILSTVRDWTSGKKAARLGVYVIPILAIVAVLTLVHIPLRLDAKGQLLPVQRQIVFAPLRGKVVELKVRHGERVDKGQEMLLIEDLDTQLQVDQLGIKISSAEQRIALLSEQIGKCTNSDERNALTRDRINQEYEMRKAIAERDILLQGSRSPRKSPVLAALAGKVVTFDVREQLLGKTVKPGDSLLRIAAVKGAWEIELQIPERNLGPIREGLHHSAQGYVDVDLLLANQPQRAYKGRLHLDGLGGETVVKDNHVVLPARVRINDVELASQLDSIPVGLEVRTKVHCGTRPIGQVWFYEIWEFFYEHVVF